MFDYLGEAAEDFNFKDGSEEVEYDARLTQPLRARHFTKNRYSAFVETPLSTLLDEANVDTLVICGFMTNFCCDSTAREAHDRDYFVDFVVDATGTPGTETLDENEIREVVSDLLGEGYARVVTTAELLHAL
jgi:nicotinamidase-related amidase